MVREVLEWVDDKMETEVYQKLDEEPDSKLMTKAFGLGAVEGLIDGLAVGGAMLLVTYGVCVLRNFCKK